MVLPSSLPDQARPLPADFLLGVEARPHPAPWRPLALWAILAAGLAAGALADWPILLLAGLLADGLWGGVWRGLAGLGQGWGASGAGAGAGAEPGIWLPYLQPGSPAARLLGGENAGDLFQHLRVALPTLLWAGVLAGVLGPAALLLTAAFALVAGVAGLAIHNPALRPLPLHSLTAILLPWALGLALLDGGASTWGLALLWTLHHWGAHRGGPAGPDRLGLALMALATVGIAALLILAQAALGLAVLAALWLPAWLFTAQGSHPQRVALLWTVTMLVSGLALGGASAL